MSDMHLPQWAVADDWDECRSRYQEQDKDTLFLTDGWDKGMYVIGQSGLNDYDGHNAPWQCHNVYFLEVI